MWEISHDRFHQSYGTPTASEMIWVSWHKRNCDSFQGTSHLPLLVVGMGALAGPIRLVLWFNLFVSFGCAFIAAQLHPDKPAQYLRLPSLRKQAVIQDQWRDERVSRIPMLLKKYGADAWLVSDC